MLDSYKATEDGLSRAGSARPTFSYYDKKDKPRVKTGRTKIGDQSQQRSNSLSKRALVGTLETMRVVCPFCRHGKSFKNVNSSLLKCCKCKNRFGG